MGTQLPWMGQACSMACETLSRLKSGARDVTATRDRGWAGATLEPEQGKQKLLVVDLYKGYFGEEWDTY